MNRIRQFIAIIGFCLAGTLSAQTYIQYVDSADYYIKRELWDKAEEMTIAALKKMPANKLNYLLWSNLGEIRSRKGETDKALEAFEIALASNPTNPSILTKRAYTFLQKGETEAALQDINLSLQQDSIQQWPLKVRAIMSLSAGEYDAAERDYITLLKYFPVSEDAYIGLGKIASAKGDTEKAIKMFKQSIETKQNEEAWFLLVLLQIENDNLSQAKEDLLLAMKRYPRSGNLFLLRGVIHKKNFENDAATLDRKIALEHGADKELVARLLPMK